MVIGTRGSALALAQAAQIKGLIEGIMVGARVVVSVIRTEGDTDKHSPLSMIGGQGVFTSALEAALTGGEIDVAVHSAKDLPSFESAGVGLGFLSREDPRDALVSRHGLALSDLPPGPRIGTSSRRRATQVLAVRPDARIVELRGNIDTRLNRAMAEDLDGIVIAVAGVTRMGWQDRLTEYLSLDHFIPAPGQGALALQVRRDDLVGETVLTLDDPIQSLLVRAERAVLRALGAGCTTPVGAHASMEGDLVRLRCMLASEDGTRVAWRDERLRPEGADQAAHDIAAGLLAEVVPDRTGRLGVSGAPALSGRTVLVTRPDNQADELAETLARAGAEVIRAPMIAIAAEPFEAGDIGRRLASGRFDWVAFTSQNGVAGLLAGLAETGQHDAAWPVRVAAVGESTAASLRAAGYDEVFVAAGGTARSLTDEMISAGARDGRVLLPQGNIARDDLARGLRDAGNSVETVTVYRTEPVDALPEEVIELLASGRVDVVTFTSPSAVRTFRTLLDGLGMTPATIAAACIGDVTAEAAREAGWPDPIVARAPTVGALVEAIAAHRRGADANRGGS
ncbi:MAG: hydroxymethylbilane synthase [Thermomicrobiales bacterium]